LAAANTKSAGNRAVSLMSLRFDLVGERIGAPGY
jgi:hypothetical protein